MPNTIINNTIINNTIKKMLIVALSIGYENGHQDTVEGTFYGDGRIETHYDLAKEVVEEALSNDFFEDED